MGKFYSFCWWLILVVLGCSRLSVVGTADIIASVEELSGPKLISYPSTVTHFSNSVGLTLTCRATGPSPLLITWLSVDIVSGGIEELPKIPGVREQLDNGSLHFSPFRADEYISSVHNGRYRCSARNTVGTYLSPVFQVEAVIDENFQVSIKSTSGQQQQDWLEGNPALLQCHVNNPTFYNKFIRIIAWKEIDQFGHEREITPEDNSKYIITSRSQKLLILQAPSQRLFVCVAQNTLNKHVKASAPFLFKSKTTSPPMAPQPFRDDSLNKISVFKAQNKSTVDLLCIVTGSPVPLWRWEKLELNGRWMPLSAASKVSGPLLRLTFDEVDETWQRINGTYRCEASNALGSSTNEYSVEIQDKSTVSMEPKRLVAYPGQTADYSCTFARGNLSLKSGDFVWYKNGMPLITSSRVKVSAYQLKILNVRLEDQGVYQCFAENSSVGSAELIFPPSAPELVHTFISQSVQPGPSISLKCSAMGNPTPVISWFIDDLMVSSSRGSSAAGFDVHQVERKYLWMSQQQRSRFHLSGTGGETGNSQESSFYHGGREVVSYLNISTVHVEDSGMYKCSAGNLVRAVSHSARLNVYGEIFVREMLGSPLTYAHGDTVYIPCHYGGYPVDKIIWQKDTRNLISNVETDPEKISGDQKTPVRFSMFPNGTLRISEISADSPSDKGRYTCVISNRKGEVASGSVSINVMHPPSISSLKFEDTLSEGQRTSLVCNVISGDLPINISWLKDSLPIPAYLKVTENRVRFLSVLAFDELHETHTGEYTCIAENPARVVKQSATLLVRVSPKWTRPPQSTKAVLGSEHEMECRAKGVPSPTVSWFRESNGIKVPLRTNHKFHLLSNGTLLKIRQIQESDGGMYICQAENSVGASPITQTARLDVIIPARISGSETSSTSVVVIAEGASTTLTCQIHGDRPLQVMWKKDSVLLDDQSASSSPASRGLFHLQKVVHVNSTVLSAELKIDSGSLEDSGIYECVASNQYGRDEKKIKLQVKVRPLAPEDFMVEEIGSRFIRLKWSSSLVSSSLTDPITHFLVQWKKEDGPGSSIYPSSWQLANNLTVQAYLNQAVVESLAPVTNYAIRLFAYNKIGQSLPTQPLLVLTLAEPPSGPPLNVSAIPIGPKSVVVRWKPPELTRQHGTIQGYAVTAVLQQQQQFFAIFPKGSNKNVSVDVKLSEETELQGLRPNAQYRVSVSAYNSAGQGPESPFLFIQTPEGAPDSPPVNVQCEPLSPKSVQVHWGSPPEYLQNGNILGYKVIYISVEGERLGEKPEVKKTSNKETTLHGLKSFTSYSVKVLAYTVGGESEPSGVVHCSTEEDVPGEPSDVKVICSGTNSVVVSWLPPNSPNGLITKYTVFWKMVEDDREVGSLKEKQFLPTSTSGQFSKEIRGLKENVQYKFWVSAMTTAGHGKPSKTETVHLTPNAVPRIVSFSITKSVAVGDPVVLPCLVFASGGLSPRITWFRDHSIMDTRSIWKNGTLSISRVKDYDEGSYTCRAENEHGSDEIEHRVVISRPPGAVPLFLGYVTHSSIQVHWDPPSKTNPPLIGYLLEWRASQDIGDHQWSAVKLGEHFRSHILEELRCGTQYQIRISGVNKVGRGVYSESLISRTSGRNPEEKPRLTEILDGNGTMVRIDLTRWADGGCPIKKFHVEYRKINESSWTSVVQRKDNLTTVNRVFTIRTDIKSRYEIQVKVENDAGLVTKRFLVESHPDFFKNYAKVLERVELGERENGSGNNVVPFYTDPHVLVPIISAVICTAAAAVCLMMVIIRRRNLRKQQQQSPNEWKFSGGVAVVAQGARHSQQSWLSGSGGGEKCNSDLTDGGGATTETTSIYATLNSTKPIPMTIRDSTVRLHSFGTYDNYDAAPMNTHHSQHNMIPATGQYMKKVRRKSTNSPLSPVEVCMQQVPCQIDFPGTIEPPHEFRSSTSSHILHHHHSGSDSEEHPASHFTQNRRGRQTPAAGYIQDGENNDEMYHDYSYPYHEFPQTSSSNEMLQQQNHPNSSNANTLKKSSSRKLQSGAGNKAGGNKRGSRGDEYFQ